MTLLPLATCDAVLHKIDLPANKSKFNYFKTPPYPSTTDNVRELKEWLLDQFVTTIFNNSGKFPTMSSLPAHIHLKEGATPKVKHNPIPVLYYYKEEVKKPSGMMSKGKSSSPYQMGPPLIGVVLQRKMGNQGEQWATNI